MADAPVVVAVPVVPQGYKELQDALEAVGPLTAEIIKIIKLAKAKKTEEILAELMKNAMPGTPLWNLVQTAIAGSEKIPAEVKDLTADEIRILIPIAVDQAFDILDAIRTPVAATPAK
jgi:hypothetical protein